MITIEGAYTTAKIFTDEVEESCLEQIKTMANHPAFTNPIAIMPDTHAGKGSVIGFTMEISNKVIPNVVGVDIGCGMLSIDLGDQQKDLVLEDIDKEIRRRVPMGFNLHELPNYETHDALKKALSDWRHMQNALLQQQIDPGDRTYSHEWFETKCTEIGTNPAKVMRSLGTLGGGNHFIELGRSAVNGHLWLTIHTGSRNFGLRICNYWQKVAENKVKSNRKSALTHGIERIKGHYPKHEWEEAIRSLKWNVEQENPITGLEALQENDVVGYLVDMIFAQAFAAANRWEIAETILAEVLGVDPSLGCSAGTHPTESNKAIECVHNYISPRDLTVRKGAVSAYEGEKIIIPFNMRDGLLICEGKGNEEWNNSAPHGAGRVMSRKKAKRELDLKEFKEQMAGIYSTSVVASTLDEAPDAYKNPKIIEEALEPTAKIVDRIVPILNLKAC
jgi:RNA-splicing ligase RtcB